MREVELPEREGWYAFHGFYAYRNGHLKPLSTLLQVRMIGGRKPKSLQAQVSTNNWRELSAFRGRWWEVELPWERENE